MGEGATALRQPPLPHVGEHGARDAHDVDAPVRPEALVFDRDERGCQVRRDVGQRHLESPFFEDGEGRRILDVVEDGGLRHFAHAAHVGNARQVGDDAMNRPRHAEDDRELGNEYQGRSAGSQTRHPDDEGPQQRRETQDERTSQD